jgi:hypothetical protein
MSSASPSQNLTDEDLPPLTRSERLDPTLVEAWWVQLCNRQQASVGTKGQAPCVRLEIGWARDPLEHFGQPTSLAWAETFELLHQRRGDRFLLEFGSLNLEWSLEHPPSWVHYLPQSADEAAPSGSPWGPSRGIEPQVAARIRRTAWFEFAPE